MMSYRLHRLKVTTVTNHHPSLHTARDDVTNASLTQTPPTFAQTLGLRRQPHSMIYTWFTVKYEPKMSKEINVSFFGCDLAYRTHTADVVD